ncbi:DUF6471 domain-containing protein [Pararobbsia alpina]|uniref:DUF6471 domain-containing protein n=1 Tax=Pararobbsia alpina TaxID=621374 RepID=UPI0039A5D8E8
MRVALARHDVTYASLSESLVKDGVSAGQGAIVSRISRGTVHLSLFLRVISMTGDDTPKRWIDALRAPASWEARASAVMKAELARQPTESSSDIVGRLERMGAPVSLRTFDSRVRSGDSSLAFFLQLLYVLNADSAGRYVAFESLMHAAQSGSAQRR